VWKVQLSIRYQANGKLLSNAIYYKSSFTSNQCKFFKPVVFKPVVFKPVVLIEKRVFYEL
jgi:hypothetical protein